MEVAKKILFALVLTLINKHTKGATGII